MKGHNLIPLVGLLFTACVNTKKTTAVWIPGNQTVYEKVAATVTKPRDEVITKELNKGIRARIILPVVTTPTEVLGIKFIESITGKSSVVGAPRLATTEDPSGAGHYVPAHQSVPSGTAQDQTFLSTKFKYIEYKPVFQTLSIPLKFRPSLRDTIASTASASFNVGFAYAFKSTVNTYRKIFWNDNNVAKPLAHHFQKITYAFGPFTGPTIVELKPGNTDGVVKKERSVIGATYGAFGVIGYNELNVGLAIGWDNTFGKEVGSWIYKGKPWLGFVLAIDIIK